MSATSTETNLQLTTTGSKPLIINPFSFNSAKVQSVEARRRAEMLQEQRSWSAISQVSRVTSTTVDFRAIIIDSYSYTYGSDTVKKVNLLVQDATALYTGSEDIFQSKVGKNGEQRPAEIQIDKVGREIMLPIGKSAAFPDTLKEWAEKDVFLADCGTHYRFTSPCNIDARLSLTSPVSTDATEIHSLVDVSVSVFAYLPSTKPDPKDPKKEIRIPESVGMSFRVHSIKKISSGNSARLFHLFAKTPSMYRMPVPSYSEIKQLDVDIRNAGKEGKQKKMVGAMLVTVPCLLGIEALEEEILKMPSGTVGTIVPVAQTSKSSFGHTKKDDNVMQIAELLLNLYQWNAAGETFRDVVSFRLWEDALRIYGCGDTGPWANGLGQALVTQTPAFFVGNIDHSDSDALMRAKTDDSIRSEISMVAKSPIVDLPGSIASRIGIPVSARWVETMALLRPRQGPNSAPSPHQLFTFAPPATYEQNLYNKNPNSCMFVINEQKPVEREDVLKDKANFNFFVVTTRIFNDADFEVLEQLRELQRSPSYKGPLGEMLVWRNWNAAKPNEWKTFMYKDSKDVECTIPENHPVLVGKVSSMAPNDTHYIYAVNPARYNQTFPKQSITQQQQQESSNSANASNGNLKRGRDNDDDEDSNDQQSAKFRK